MEASMSTATAAVETRGHIPEHLLRLPDVCARVGVRHSKLYELIAAGDFPRPVKVGGTRASRWPSSEVDAWIAARIAERDAGGAQ